MEKVEIERIIPHRYPFLLVDRIVELRPGERATGLKTVTGSEPYLQQLPGGGLIMPGVLVLEALAQVGSVAVLSSPQYRGKITLLAGIDRARFYGHVFPGEELFLQVKIEGVKRRVGRRKCRASAGNRLVAEAEILFFLAERAY